MPNTCSAMGFASRMLVKSGASPTFDNTSEPYEILAENIVARKILQGRNKITGDPSLRNGNLRKHTYLVRGSIVLQPGPAQLDNWLPRILGGTPSGTSYPLATDLPTFGVLLDRENAIFRYDNLKVNAAIFQSRSAEGEDTEELVTLTINVIGMTEVADGESWPGTAPDLSFGGANVPYAHWEGAFDVGGTDIPYGTFNLQILNNLRPHFYNGLTPSCIRRQGSRMVRLRTDNPFTATTFAEAEALYEASKASTLTFTNGGMSTAFSMPYLRNSYLTPSVRGKGEIPLQLNLEAVSDVANGELAVTHDSTP